MQKMLPNSQNEMGSLRGVAKKPEYFTTIQSDRAVNAVQYSASAVGR